MKKEGIEKSSEIVLKRLTKINLARKSQKN
jgi:hypothetical protein